MKIARHSLIPLVLLGAVSACFGEKGSGVIKTESRSVGPFREVEVIG